MEPKKYKSPPPGDIPMVVECKTCHGDAYCEWWQRRKFPDGKIHVQVRYVCGHDHITDIDYAPD